MITKEKSMVKKITHNLVIVIPVLNEELIIENTIKNCSEVVSKITESFRIVVVDDGSTDLTWQRINDLSLINENLVGIRLSRNFGKDNALMAGLSIFHAKTYVTIDADGEHPFEKIPEMLAILKKNKVDVVNGVKIHTKTPSIRKHIVKIISRVIDNQLEYSLLQATEFKVLRYRVVQELLALSDYDTFFRAQVAWLGFKQENFAFDIGKPSREGTRFSLKSLIDFTTTGVLLFSDIPLRLFIVSGVLFLLFGISLFIKVLIDVFIGSPPRGISTIIILLLFNIGVTLGTGGVVGLYVNAALRQGLKRPSSIIFQRTDDEED